MSAHNMFLWRIKTTKYLDTLLSGAMHTDDNLLILKL